MRNLRQVFLHACQIKVRIFSRFGVRPKIRDHVTLATPPFREISHGLCRDYVGTFPGSMRAKFEVRSFSHYGAIGI